MKELIFDVKLGSDPELFIWDKAKQQFKSSIGLIGGSKFDPIPLDIPGFFAQEDNVLVEFNIPPASEKQGFISNIELGKAQIEELLGSNFELKVVSSAFMPMEELEHPSAQEFGCTPDYNAWDKGHYNKKPDNPVNGLRSAGGHIHIGFEPNQEIMKSVEISRSDLNVELIKLCDLYLGIPSIVMDTDKERRKLYGKAGAFRHKPYGVEYRVLSSFWLKNKDLIGWAFDQTMAAVEDLKESKFIGKPLGSKVEEIINNQDEKGAMKLIKDLNLSVA